MTDATLTAAISRLDLSGPGQCSFLFTLIRQQTRSQWANLINQHIIFPLVNNPNSSGIFRAILSNDDWREWVWPLFQRDSVTSLLPRSDERLLFTTTMNLFAVIHHYVFMNQADQFKLTLLQSLSELRDYAGWDHEPIMLGRLMLYSAANKIGNSAQVIRRSIDHPGWANLSQFIDVVEQFIFFMPTSTTQRGGSAASEAGFHIDTEGVFLDLHLIELCIRLYRESLKVETMVNANEPDKKLLASQKLQSRIAIDNMNYLVQVYSFFQSFEEGTINDQIKNDVIKSTSARNKNMKSALKQCIQSFEDTIEQQKRNQQLAGAASLAKRVYLKVNDTIVVKEQGPAASNGKALLGPAANKRLMTMKNREQSYDQEVPIVHIKSTKRADDHGAILAAIRSELGQQKQMDHIVSPSKSIDGHFGEQIQSQWTALSGAYAEYIRLLDLEHRAMIASPSTGSAPDVSSREVNVMAGLNGLIREIQAHNLAMRERAQQIISKQDPKSSATNVDEDANCNVQ